MSTAIGIPRVKCNQLRTTSIQEMKAKGLDDRFIQTITKHKYLGTLKNYDPQPAMTKRFEGAKALMSVKKSRSSITKKVSKQSIIQETVTFHESSGQNSGQEKMVVKTGEI